MFGFIKRKTAQATANPEPLYQPPYPQQVASYWLLLKRALVAFCAEAEYEVATRSSYAGYCYFSDNHTADTDITLFLAQESASLTERHWERPDGKRILQEVVLLAVCLRECVVPLIEEHIATLLRKQKTLIIADDYGNYNFKKWDREVSYFYETLLDERVAEWYRRRPEQIAVAFDLESLSERTDDPDKRCQRRRDDICSCFYALLNNAAERYQAAHQPAYYHAGFSGLEYENYIADLMLSCGLSVQITRASGDHGADIIAEYQQIRIAVQCKHYSDKVGNKAVQEVYSAMHMYDCNVPLVVTNSVFTAHAREAAAKLDVVLLHHEELPGFLRQYVTG